MSSLVTGFVHWPNIFECVRIAIFMEVLLCLLHSRSSGSDEFMHYNTAADTKPYHDLYPTPRKNIVPVYLTQTRLFHRHFSGDTTEV